MEIISVLIAVWESFCLNCTSTAECNFSEMNNTLFLFGSIYIMEIRLTDFEDKWNRWVHFGKDLELLDSPGILPMRISDQTAAIKLAICDDIGERSYDVFDVATILVNILVRLPTVGRSLGLPNFLFSNNFKLNTFLSGF